MLKAYKEKAPNVEIKTSEFDLPQINDKVNIDFQAKKGEYDIVWMNSAQTVGYWTEAGIVVPLDEMISKSYDLDDFLKLAKGIGTVKDKLYGIAIMIEERMLSYRKDLFECRRHPGPEDRRGDDRCRRKADGEGEEPVRFLPAEPGGGPPSIGWAGCTPSVVSPSTRTTRLQLTSPEAKAALDAFLKIEKLLAGFQQELRRDRQGAADRRRRDGERRDDHHAAVGRFCPVPVRWQVRLRRRAGWTEGSAPGDVLAPVGDLVAE